MSSYSTLSEALHNQSKRQLTFSRITNNEGSSSHTATTALPNKINTNTLPQFPLVDSNPSSAMAYNIETESLADARISDTSNETFKKSALYNSVNSWQYGYRTPASTADIRPMQSEVDESDDMDIDTDDYYNKLSSALYGYHAVDPEVLEANLGNLNFGRNHGFDRINNPSIFGSPANGLPLTVSPSIPISNERFRINDTLISPVMTSKNLNT